MNESGHNVENTQESVNALLIETLSSIAPTFPGMEYVGNLDPKNSRYIVFNYTTMSTGFADNMPLFERYLIQVHYYCPVNDSTVAIRSRIKKMLFQAGFTWPDEHPAGSSADDHSGAEGQHYCFECKLLAVIPEDADGED